MLAGKGGHWCPMRTAKMASKLPRGVVLVEPGVRQATDEIEGENGVPVAK